MAHRLATNYAKNYCNRTLIVKVIVENVVTCFLGDTVYELIDAPSDTTNAHPMGHPFPQIWANQNVRVRPSGRESRMCLRLIFS